MAELKATPGPYEVEIHTNGCVFITSPNVPASKGDVADLYHTFPNRENVDNENVRIVTKENAENNAHLLGASWDLYHALQRAKDAMEFTLTELISHTNEDYEQMKSDFEIISAALAKARGEPS